jgi:hypothetical protein
MATYKTAPGVDYEPRLIQIVRHADIFKED